MTSLAAGDIADLSPSTFSYPWQLPTSMGSLFLSSAINLSPVSLPPPIIGHWCQFISGINDTGDKFFAGVVDTAEQLFAGAVDTGDKH
jgi:hypothetical protein